MSVLLPIGEYEALIACLEDREDLDDAREALARLEHGKEHTISWDAVKAEHGL